MKYKQLPGFALILFLCLSPFFSLAQTAVLKGKLSDTTNYKPMAFSSVSLVRQDSVLLRTKFTDQNSSFLFTQLPADTYTLLITRPSYADYEERITLSEGETKDMGTIILLSKENLLKEVLIKDFSAIKIKGDTTEFRVDSFLVNKNSNVEDLLKRLPGISVDKSGKITAQGQEVKKVLVDGEEFFGNDPTVATKNLRADNVETVQVFDKKSEQTQQTGIDDGTKEKTINLTLKDEAKKGYFGKVGAGIGTKNDSKIDGVSTPFGTENRYEGEAMYNNFKDKRKASVFSTFSNTNKTDLNWEDREKYMGGNNVEYNEADGYMYSYFEYDPNGYNGNGIPQTSFVGGNFSDKVNKDKLGYNLNATYRQTLVKGIDKNYSQYILPDTMYFNTQYNTMDNRRDASNASGKVDYKIDSLSSFQVKGNITRSSFDNKDAFTSKNYNGLSQIVNENTRINNNTGTNINGNYSLFYNKKFKKTGRSTNIYLDHKFNSGTSDGILISKTVFYNGDSTINSEQDLDQLRNTEETGNTLGGRLTYTEPLSKKLSLLADYDFHATLNHSLIRTFKKSPSGGYTQQIDSLSNDLDYKIGIQKGGITLRYITKKVNASLGGRVSYTNLVQKNYFQNTTIEQPFLNFYPAASINYKMATTKSVRFSYNGRTQQPTLQMINPIQNLSNPLVVYKGNPNLRQMFDNDVSFNYNSYKPISGRSIYLSLSYSYTFHDFANYDEVDYQGRRIYKTVNVDGNQSINLYCNYFFKIPKLHLGTFQSLSGGVYKTSNFINGLANTNQNANLNYTLDFTYEKEEKYTFNLSPDITWNHSTTSLRPDVVTQFFTYSLFGSVNVFLPKKFEWYIDGRYNVRQQTQVFNSNHNTFIVSAFVSRRFLKEENLLLRLGVEDLLNQNIGFERTANSNYINENTYIVLRRYFMITLTYNFNNQPKAETNE